MFKSILPAAKRVPGSDVVVNIGEGKENSRPSGSLPQINQRSPTKSLYPNATMRHTEPLATDREFEKLLDDLQIPTTLRPKLATLESPVKAAMLRSSHVLTSPDLASPHPVKRPKLRKSLSSTHIDSPRKNVLDYDFLTPPQAVDAPLAAPIAPFMIEGPGRPPSAQGHARGTSLDNPRATSHSYTTSGNAKPGTSKPAKGLVRDLSPVALCTMLSETSSTHLELEIVKKLRLLLRNETASWSEEFLRKGGYAALLTRLVEILEIEWREEQHDDQILHELLRCFKALSTSSIGCFALRSSCPTPFVQLVSLLYSDKKPGDLCTRQLIVDLLLLLFEIYPTKSQTSNSRTCGDASGHVAGDLPTSPSTSNACDALPSPHKTLYSLVRALLLTPAPPPTEAPSTPISPHAFIASLHTPRIYKSYLHELSDTCRDYFWVFCHPQNVIWNLDQTDEAKVVRPRAPGGMTGGVEYEAMGYLTSHFQLVNSLAKAAQDLDLPPDNEYSAYMLHADLFASGIERIILTARKASTTYYSALHLEVARYIALVYRARFELPWNISRMIGPPPAPLLRDGVTKSANGSPRGSPVKNRGGVVPGGPPKVPTPKRADPIKF